MKVKNDRKRQTVTFLIYRLFLLSSHSFSCFLDKDNQSKIFVYEWKIIRNELNKMSNTQTTCKKPKWTGQTTVGYFVC
jgi:hypothetical protein